MENIRCQLHLRVKQKLNFFFSEYDGFFYKENYQLVILILVKFVAQKVNTTVFIYIYIKRKFLIAIRVLKI